ncbi:MAG: GlxA family transcriptional regulator, partial [Rhodobacteraceae bacterium]|nr:GlxA family transcriptional regulator [Paracoccaceae bacterium]
MQEQRQVVDVDTTASKPKRYIFVLLNRFSMLSFASAIECLRIANRMAGKQIYSWRTVGEGGDLVSCSAGTTFKLDDDLVELLRDDTIMLCGGIDVQ